MLTTMFPWNAPAGAQGMLVMYMGTLRPSSMCRTGIPASSKSASKEKLQPMRKLTRSSRQSEDTSVRSHTIAPRS